MLRYFPNIYPDELLYSAFCRYYRNTGKGNIKQTYSELFGNNHVFSLVDFPYNIDSFVNQFENAYCYSAEDIIFKFTMLPLFHPFLNSKMQEEAIYSMKGNDGKSLLTKLGIVASSIKCLMFLKYCPDCLYEDIQTYGEGYLHRSHNLDGVFVCYKHNKFLRANCPICNVPIAPKYKYNITPLETTCKNGHDLVSSYIKNNPTDSPLDLEHYLLVSKLVNYILNMDYTIYNTNFNTLHDKYIYKLYKLGYITVQGRIRQKILKKDFINFYGSNFLKKLQLEIDYNKPYCWIGAFLDADYKTYHPLKHILFLIFICSNDEPEIYKLLTDNKDYSLNLFGKGPWPCFNPVSDHFMQRIITDLSTTTSTKNHVIIGTFKCSCGFIYTKQSSIESKSDNYSIKSFGFVWEERLKNIIVDEGGSLRSIARKMQCDPKTVIRYASKLGLNFCWNSRPEHYDMDCINNVKEDNNNSECLLNEYKNRIQNYISSQSTPQKAYQIRKLFQKEYTFLYRHNKEMLPDLFKECFKSRNYNGRNAIVDWDKRDVVFFHLVSNEIEQLLSSKQLMRITINKIGRDLGILYILQKHIHRLPKTQTLINASIESVEEFQIRRIRSVFDRLKSNDEVVTRSKLYRYAGLKASCSSNVKNEVKTLLNSNT